MANWYVWNGGSGTGVAWATAYTTLGAALTAKAAGDTFFVAHDHVETTAAALTLTSPGTDAAPCRIYCVNRAGTVPPVSADLRTTATISTTGASTIAIAGAIMECYGIIFSAGDAANTAAFNLNSSSGARVQRFVSCSFRLTNTSTSSRINAANSSINVVSLENCTLQFGSVSQLMINNGSLFWRNTPSAILGATLPTILLGFTITGAYTFVEGVDLSALGSGKTLVQATSINNPNAVTVFKDCKLGASVIPAATPNSSNANDISFIRCDSGDTNYRTERYHYTGTMTTETTIVRTGGATDGTTPIAWKIVTTANSKWEWPFECLPISIWNETVGSAVTVTIQGIWGTGSVPRNDDIWIDCEYLGTSGFPLATKATSNKADGLIADAAIPAGSGTWGGSTTKFAMSATFTPQEKGPITIYVRAALPSSTFYVDPKPVVT